MTLRYSPALAGGVADDGRGRSAKIEIVARRARAGDGGAMVDRSPMIKVRDKNLAPT
jgi:hypothetical protein